MVRPADLRKRKYEGKVDPDTLAIQTRALKPLMVRGETEYFPAIATVEDKVKRLVEAEGVPTIQVRDYLNFGREMYELTKRFSGSTLSGEAQLRVNKWSSRGLTGSILVRIANLFGVSPLTPPPANGILDLINDGYFNMMIGEAIPSPNVLLYKAGSGSEEYSGYGWYVGCFQNASFEVAREFGSTFRRTKVYLTGLDFHLWREWKTPQSHAELWVDTIAEENGVPVYILYEHISDNQIPQGSSDWSFSFDPPPEIPLNLCFCFGFYVHVWSDAPGVFSSLKITKCWLKSKLVV